MKKVTAVLLAVIMLVFAMPMSGFATQVDKTVDVILVAGQSNNRGYSYGNESTAVHPQKDTVYFDTFGNNELSDPGVRGAHAALGKTWYELTGHKVLVINAAVGGSGFGYKGSADGEEWLAPDDVGDRDSEELKTSVRSTALTRTAEMYRVGIKSIIDAGYKVGSRAYTWLQGEADETLENADVYQAHYLKMHAHFMNGFKDIASDTAYDVSGYPLEVCGFLSPRQAGYGTTILKSHSFPHNVGLFGAKTAQYNMANTRSDMVIISNITEKWYSDEACEEWFINKYATTTDAATRKASAQAAYSAKFPGQTMPTAVSTVYGQRDMLHYMQQGYNELGEDAATNLYKYMFGNYKATGISVINTAGLQEYAFGETFNIANYDNEALIAAYPLYAKNKNVKVTLTDTVGTVDDKNIITVKKCGMNDSSTLTATFADGTLSNYKVTAEFVEYAAQHFAWLFDNTLEADDEASSGENTVVSSKQSDAKYSNGALVLDASQYYNLENAVELIPTRAWQIDFTATNQANSIVVSGENDACLYFKGKNQLVFGTYGANEVGITGSGSGEWSIRNVVDSDSENHIEIKAPGSDWKKATTLTGSDLSGTTFKITKLFGGLASAGDEYNFKGNISYLAIYEAYDLCNLQNAKKGELTAALATYTSDNYTVADWKKIDTIATKAITDIENATNEEKINYITENAISSLAAVTQTKQSAQDNFNALNSAVYSITGHSYSIDQSNDMTEATLKAYVEGEIATIDLNGATNYTVNTQNYTAPIKGTQANAAGTDGSYSFTVTLEKGNGDNYSNWTSTTVTMPIYCEKYYTIVEETEFPYGRIVTPVFYDSYDVTLADGSTANISGLKWSCGDYKYKTPGEYVFVAKNIPSQYKVAAYPAIKINVSTRSIDTSMSGFAFLNGIPCVISGEWEGDAILGSYIYDATGCNLLNEESIMSCNVYAGAVTGSEMDLESTNVTLDHACVRSLYGGSRGAYKVENITVNVINGSSVTNGLIGGGNTASGYETDGTINVYVKDSEINSYCVVGGWAETAQNATMTLDSGTVVNCNVAIGSYYNSEKVPFETAKLIVKDGVTINGTLYMGSRKAYTNKVIAEISSNAYVKDYSLYLTPNNTKTSDDISIYVDNNFNLFKLGDLSGAKLYINNELTDTTNLFYDCINHWGKDAASYVAKEGIFLGTGDYQFSPDAKMTRGMFATVLNRYSKDETVYTSDFADVTSDAWYANAVGWAKEKGVVYGTGVGFEPNGNVTREQLVAMLYRYYKTLDMVDTTQYIELEFTDTDKIDSYAVEAVRWAVKSGVVGGRDDGSFDPDGLATRAEAASIMMRFCEITK